MKLRCVLIATLFVFAGCKTTLTGDSPSIVGVWELKEVHMSRMSQLPQVGLTNAKEIYTANGLYHNVPAESAQIANEKPQRYTFGNGIVTLFSVDGQYRTIQSKVRFVSARVMELTTREGDTMVYNKISDDPGKIPLVQKRMVPARMK